MTTSRSRYSTAPTYGMQKRPAPKKRPAPAGPYFQPEGGQPYPPAQGQGQTAGTPPVSAPYPPLQSQAHAPQPPAYAAPNTGFSAQPGYAPAQPGFVPQPQQAVPAQAAPYPYQMPYPAQPLPQEYAVRTKPRHGEGWLAVSLLAVLPILAILALFFIQTSGMKIAFVAVAVLSLLTMWMQHSFIPSARATLSLVYGALIVVCAFSLVTSATPGDRTTSASNGSQNTTTQSSGLSGDNGSSLMAAGDTTTAVPATPTPSPETGEDSAAWQRLQQFFQFWVANNLDNMLELVSPTWTSAQDNAKTNLFLILSNRIPLDFSFEKISGSDADSSRTVTMTATIDKRNSRDPVKIRFQIVMLKDNENWYVDPNSLVSNDVVEEETTDTSDSANAVSTSILITATPKPTATPGPKTKLYYNKSGGKYYHSDPECSSVDEKYLPLTSFYYRDLNNTTFKNLLPCPRCNAPARP